MKTENVYVGTKVGYSVTNPKDVELDATGYFEVANSGLTELKITPIKDYQTEGPETLTFTLINSNFGGTQYEGVNISVEIVDTSRPPTYELSSTSLAIDEGDSVTITLTTTNVDENVKVAYVLTNIVDLGIVDPSGSFTIDSAGKSSISFTPISRLFT